jgi:DNA-directed RNA polymerase subunit RPC12/RpoP
MKFRCRACHEEDIRVDVYRKGVLQTVLEIFCPKCGHKVLASLMYETEGLNLD